MDFPPFVGETSCSFRTTNDFIYLSSTSNHDHYSCLIRGGNKGLLSQLAQQGMPLGPTASEPPYEVAARDAGSSSASRLDYSGQCLARRRERLGENRQPSRVDKLRLEMLKPLCRVVVCSFRFA